jgi:hypothetical protein
MSELAGWQQGNARYLSEAVAWLRARLERRAAQEPVSMTLTPSQPKEEPRSFWQQLVRRPPAEAGSISSLVPAPRTPNAGGQPERTSADLVVATSQMDPPPALVILGQRLGLSQFEREILLLCAAMELDTGIAPLCARAQGDPGRPYPTFALALTLFDEPAWDALSPERPLRFWRLIEINQPAAQPLTTSPLRADERIVNYVKGLNYLDDRLAPLLTSLEFTGSWADSPASHRDAAEHILRQLKQAPPAQRLPVIQLLGSDAPSKQLVMWQVAGELGLRAYRLPSELLPTQAAELESLGRLWQREILLLPVTLYLDAQGCEGEGSHSPQAAAVSRLLSRISGVTFLDTRDVWPGLTQPTVPVDIAKPTPAEQQTAWASALDEAAGESPALLAGQFNLNLASIREIARKVLSESTAEEHSLQDRLWGACLAGTRPRLEVLAQRIEPKAAWDDIVLPPTETSLLRQIAAQVGQRSTVYRAWGFADKMSRGLGINALFAGESGTGKTMAAEVLANHLRLNIYRIDLSAVVSKYIGETEKNLRRLFDAAEDGGAILFFDEADALFGKRSEVKDSHDRYANIEINYLLQRMEAYRGVAILATNMKSALDPAFLRRLRFVVTFPFPGVAERKAIWQKVFPSRTPTCGLDFDRLARLNLTGGHIHNIALNAAFLAARAGTPVTMAVVLDAARTEFRKLERPINEADFRWPGAKGAAA